MHPVSVLTLLKQYKKEFDFTESICLVSRPYYFCEQNSTQCGVEFLEWAYIEMTDQ